RRWLAAKRLDALMNPRYLLAALLLSPFVGAAQAQQPAPYGPAPLLHVRVIGEPGLRVTFYQGRPAGGDFAAPVQVGLRPGYIHRLKVTGFHRDIGDTEALYPTLEVIGTLQLPPTLRAADFPVPLRLSTEDIQRVLAGAFLTRVMVLEHPERAIAT